MRGLLAGIVIAALSLLGLPPASLAEAAERSVAAPAHGADGLRTWSVDLPGSGTSPRVRTGELTVAALSWSKGEPEALELRVLEGGAWSDWFPLVVDESKAPDGRRATEPFVADGARGVQSRVTASAPLEDLRVELVHVVEQLGAVGSLGAPPSDELASSPDTPPSAVAASGSPSRASATGNELRPKIISRAQWGADENGTRPVASSTWLKAMYVHHTAGPNSYSRSRAKAVVRSIWAFHTKGRGWPDIGYQFLVDRFGRVYEGRRGAIEGLPVGAQAGGYNAFTLGVSVMGDHSSTRPAQKVVDAVVDVLAWQAHKFGLDPRGKVRLRTEASTGSRTRWAKGTLTPRLPVIRGHRDTNHTACPGARLYAKLPAIRRAVDAKVKRANKSFGRTPAQLAAPRVEKLAPESRGVSLERKLRLRWSEVPGASAYEVLRRGAEHGKGTGQIRSAWRVVKRTQSTTAKVSVKDGWTWTLAVRAIDRLGRPGAVQRIGTTTRPVPAKLVKRSGSWKSVRGAAYFEGRAWASREKGARLEVKAKQARSVWLVAERGPAAGRVTVRAGSKKIAVVSLRSPQREPLALVEVPLPKRFTGKIRITARDAERPVRISAVILERGHL